MAPIVAADELDKAKAYLSGGLELRMDETRHLASWIGGQEALHDRVLTLEEALAAVDSVDAAELGRLASELFRDEGLRLARNESFDLVVSDVDMPRMDGFALTETIRGARQFAQLPVILVTARHSDEDKARGVGAGANGYVIKSAFDQRVLLETIGQLL